MNLSALWLLTVSLDTDNGAGYTEHSLIWQIMNISMQLLTNSLDTKFGTGSLNAK